MSACGRRTRIRSHERSGWKESTLAKPNYQYEKRRKEMAKAKKNEEKRQRKLDKAKLKSQGNSDVPAEQTGE